MANKPHSDHVVEELKMMRVYSHFVNELYQHDKMAELPAIQSAQSSVMASTFERANTDLVPQLNASLWFKLNDSTQETMCLSVMTSLIRLAKLVPETMLHPVSQLIQRQARAGDTNGNRREGLGGYRLLTSSFRRRSLHA